MYFAEPSFARLTFVKPQNCKYENTNSKLRVFLVLLYKQDKLVSYNNSTLTE